MKLKQSILGVLTFLLFNINVAGQSMYFNFGSGSSGFSNIISETLDLIFGGIITPIIYSISFNNFEAAAKLGLWIILFLLFSHVLKNYFKNMPPKFSKVIGAFFALFSVIFIPLNLLEFLFRDFMAGLIGFILFFFIVFWPIYALYKWSKDTEERAINLFCALGFFFMLLFLSYLDQQVVYNFNFGFMQTLSSLVIVSGVIAALVLFIHRLVKGLSGFGGGEERGRGEGTRRDEEDEAENVKNVARHLISLIHTLGEHIQHLSDDPTMLAHNLLRAPQALDFLNRPNFHTIYLDVQRIDQRLNKFKGKNKKKAKIIGGELIRAYDYLMESGKRFFEIQRKLNLRLTEAKQAINARQQINTGFFGDLIGRTRRIDRDLQELAKVVTKIETL